MDGICSLFFLALLTSLKYFSAVTKVTAEKYFKEVTCTLVKDVDLCAFSSSKGLAY